MDELRWNCIIEGQAIMNQCGYVGKELGMSGKGMKESQGELGISTRKGRSVQKRLGEKTLIGLDHVCL